MTTMRTLSLLISIIIALLITSASSQGQTRPAQKQANHYLPNYLQMGDSLRIHIRVYNSTHPIIYSNQYTLLYSLQQPALTTTIQLPIFEHMDNLTMAAQLWSEHNDKPIAITHKNLTRFAKIRSGNELVGMEMGLQGLSQDKHHHSTHHHHNNDTNTTNEITINSKFCMHVPVRFVMLVLVTEYLLPYERQFFMMFNVNTMNRQNAKHYVLPIDLSQLHVPYKTYKPLHNLIALHHQNHNNTDNNNTNNSNSNDTINHPIQLTIQPYSFTYYQFFFGFTNRQYLAQANPLLAQVYTQQTIDLIKQTLFQNNFYLVVIYFTLSIVQTFMQIFAFKNQIQVWKNIQNRPGLSIQVLYQMLVFQIIIVLYLYQKDANRLYLFFHLFDLILTVWKITKAVQVRFGSQFRFYVSLRYKEWYHRKVQSADSEATHYTNYLIIALFIPFLLYKLYPSFLIAYNCYIKQIPLPIPTLHKVYSFLLQTAVFFIFIFGFVMMTPQLYLNYKLKSVQHLPWKTLIYRFISTIIDDIFVFMIDIPWLQRMFSFRDDVIFIFYIIQRRIYRVDQNRLALASGSIDLTKLKNNANNNNAIAAQVSAGAGQQQKHIKSQ